VAVAVLGVLMVRATIHLTLQSVHATLKVREPVLATALAQAGLERRFKTAAQLVGLAGGLLGGTEGTTRLAEHVLQLSQLRASMLSAESTHRLMVMRGLGQPPGLAGLVSGALLMLAGLSQPPRLLARAFFMLARFGHPPRLLARTLFMLAGLAQPPGLGRFVSGALLVLAGFEPPGLAGLMSGALFMLAGFKPPGLSRRFVSGALLMLA